MRNIFKIKMISFCRSSLDLNNNQLTTYKLFLSGQTLSQHNGSQQLEKTNAAQGRNSTDSEKEYT